MVNIMTDKKTSLIKTFTINEKSKRIKYGNDIKADIIIALKNKNL